MDGTELIESLVVALNSMDAQLFSSLLADSVVIEHVTTGNRLEGKEMVDGWFQMMLSHTRENDVRVVRVCVQGNTIWAERIDRHLIGGEWHEIPIMGIIEYNDAGKMTLMRDYFDSRLSLM